ncbi:hypothetical protein SeMB42_g04248 [Synchytrium endobioticum]|uniref:RIIa domain-containing protein n=2 Tax=Synchytrium endobioticum TaxID=286115 RepID=A0A507D0D3_9FUNG|nr:hypothetical protein SeMB42_g04248 [Synchytrium endobioticum]
MNSVGSTLSIQHNKLNQSSQSFGVPASDAATIKMEELIETEPTTVSYEDEFLKQLKLDAINQRIDNERYLRAHPEVRHIIQYVLHQILLIQPTNVQEFIADLFTDVELRSKVDGYIKQKDVNTGSVW